MSTNDKTTLADAIYATVQAGKKIYRTESVVTLSIGTVAIQSKQGGRASGSRGMHVTTPVLTFKLDGKRIARAALEKLVG